MRTAWSYVTIAYTYQLCRIAELLTSGQLHSTPLPLVAAIIVLAGRAHARACAVKSYEQE
jgi:hypothetical protein